MCLTFYVYKCAVCLFLYFQWCEKHKRKAFSLPSNEFVFSSRLLAGKNTRILSENIHLVNRYVLNRLAVWVCQTIPCTLHFPWSEDVVCAWVLLLRLSCFLFALCHIVVICAHYLNTYTVHTQYTHRTYTDASLCIIQCIPTNILQVFASLSLPIGNSIQLIYKYHSDKVIQFLRIFRFWNFIHEAKHTFLFYFLVLIPFSGYEKKWFS